MKHGEGKVLCFYFGGVKPLHSDQETVFKSDGNISPHLLFCCLLRERLFLFDRSLEKNDEMTRIAAVLARYSQVEVKWSVSRDRRVRGEV